MKLQNKTFEIVIYSHELIINDCDIKCHHSVMFIIWTFCTFWLNNPAVFSPSLSISLYLSVLTTNIIHFQTLRFDEHDSSQGQNPSMKGLKKWAITHPVRISGCEMAAVEIFNKANFILSVQWIKNVLGISFFFFCGGRRFSDV